MSHNVMITDQGTVLAGIFLCLVTALALPDIDHVPGIQDHDIVLYEIRLDKLMDLLHSDVASSIRQLEQARWVATFILCQTNISC